MQKQITFREQLDFLVNITTIMMELIETAESLGIETEGKTRAVLVREIRAVEGAASASPMH